MGSAEKACMGSGAREATRERERREEEDVWKKTATSEEKGRDRWGVGHRSRVAMAGRRRAGRAKHAQGTFLWGSHSRLPQRHHVRREGER